MPMWQLLGSAANTPALRAGIFAGNDSLDLDHLAKAAVQKRKEQVCRLISSMALPSK